VERWRGALRELGDEAAEVTWRYGAFELDPGVPAEGVDAREYLEARYDAATVAEIHKRLAGVAAAEGLPLRDMSEQGRRPNTFAAHRLLTAARDEGFALQQDVGDRLFRAHWADGEDVGDRDVLLAIARATGMQDGRALEALTGDATSEAVRAEEQEAHDAGIRAVPTFVVGGRFAVSGAQPPAVLAGALRNALSGGAG
jgi:predicted DsbA family dithiol-disulfide isomerase